jgi:hypothetical protein
MDRLVYNWRCCYIWWNSDIVYIVSRYACFHVLFPARFQSHLRSVAIVQLAADFYRSTMSDVPAQRGWCIQFQLTANCVVTAAREPRLPPIRSATKGGCKDQAGRAVFY